MSKQHEPQLFAFGYIPIVGIRSLQGTKIRFVIESHDLIKEDCMIFFIPFTIDMGCDVLVSDAED